MAIVKSTTANLEPEAAPGARCGRSRAAPASRPRRAGRRRGGALCGRSGDRLAARRGGKADPRIQKFLTYGASPRASQYLILGAKARAILAGRFHVDFADVRAVALPVLRHRLVLEFPCPGRGDRRRRLDSQIDRDRPGEVTGS